MLAWQDLLEHLGRVLAIPRCDDGRWVAPGGVLPGVVTLAFRCSVIGGHTHPTDEARKVAWLTVDEATRDMPEARAARVTDALSDKAPFVRVHDGTRLLDF